MPKILFVGHGIAPWSVGGAVQYQEDLIREVRRRGWATTRYYAAPRYSLSGRTHLKTWWRDDVKTVEIINSPYLPYHEVNPVEQCVHAAMEASFRKLLNAEKPDLVHIHELQMHPASILGIIRAAGLPALKTMHNYYDICPQHDLMIGGRIPCADFEEGRRCLDCLAGRPGALMPFRHRIKRALTSALPPALFKPYHGLRRLLRPDRRMTKVQFVSPPSDRRIEPVEHARRREFFVERLNNLELIHCASEGAAAVFTRYGVSRDRIRVLSLASKLTDGVSPRPLRDDRFPVVFGFMGGEQYHKGFELLLAAFSRLDPAKARLEVWNTEQTGAVPGFPNVVFKGIYPASRLNGVLSGIDVGVVPSLWEESFGLVGPEFISARIPIIGARIGGIPQWLDDGVNGCLFTPGDADDLAAQLARFAEEPGLVHDYQLRMKPWKSFDVHVAEMLSLYEEIRVGRIPPKRENRGND